jgi:hypothetical protein
MRSGFAVVLATALVCPSGLIGAPATGGVQGTVTVDGRPLSGVDLSLVNIGTGRVHKTRSGSSGGFEVDLAPGAYVISGGGGSGLAVGRAPAVVRVEPGAVASANLEFVALSVPATQEPDLEQGATIQHDAVGCLLAGEFPILDAVIEPATSVVRARVYFRSALSEEWYFVEMAQVEGVFRGWLPRPQIEASPITYYIQTTTTDFGESRSQESTAQIVEFEDECEDDVIAAYGTPPADLTVFSATTGAAAGIPTGFAVGGGLALGVGAIGVIAAGAAAAGVGITQVVADDTTTTTVTTLPPPTPPPTPEPTPPPGPYNLTVIRRPDFLGEVRVDPPDLVYPAGTLVTLRAIGGLIVASPNKEIVLVRWERDCARAGSNLTCNLVMDDNKVAVAVFDAVPVSP